MDTLQISPSKDEQRTQVNRVLASPVFGNSEILRNLLSHLAQISIEESGRSVKEYEIGVAALGRGPDFDPRIDSCVRVHSARLRTKLAEYYHGEGASDPIEVCLPKGTYLLSYRYLPVRTEPPALVPVPEVSPPVSRRNWTVGLLSALGAGGAATAFWKWHDRAERPGPAVRKFWEGFDSRPHETMVVFSNPRFVGSASSGLRYAPPGAATSQETNDRYTGIGEAMALHELTRLFDRLHFPFRAKRSSLIVWDEARSRNLVFIGGPHVNDSQMELPQLQQFGFKSIEDEPRPGFGAMVNLHPAPGEEQYYFNSGPPYVMDYGVVGLVRGLSPDRRALILAGRTTFATQGVTEFLVDENNVAMLLERLGMNASSTGKLPYFEALLRVKISGGVPVQPELVLVKLRNQQLK